MSAMRVMGRGLQVTASYISLSPVTCNLLPNFVGGKI